MTTKEKQLYGDIDDLLIFAEGYLIALQTYGKHPKLATNTANTIKRISKRYKKQISKLYESPAKHPDARFPMCG